MEAHRQNAEAVEVFRVRHDVDLEEVGGDGVVVDHGVPQDDEVEEGVGHQIHEVPDGVPPLAFVLGVVGWGCVWIGKEGRKRV